MSHARADRLYPTRIGTRSRPAFVACSSRCARWRGRTADDSTRHDAGRCLQRLARCSRRVQRRGWGVCRGCHEGNACVGGLRVEVPRQGLCPSGSAAAPTGREALNDALQLVWATPAAERLEAPLPPNRFERPRLPPSAATETPIQRICSRGRPRPRLLVPCDHARRSGGRSSLRVPPPKRGCTTRIWRQALFCGDIPARRTRLRFKRLRPGI